MPALPHAEWTVLPPALLCYEPPRQIHPNWSAVGSQPMFCLGSLTTYLLEIAFLCLQVILHFCVRWEVEKQSVIWFLHLPDVSRVSFIWVRPTFSSNSRSSCMCSGNPYTRLHFLLSTIPSLIFLSSKLIFKSLGTSTFSLRQSFTNFAWGYVWSSDFSRKTSSKDTGWNPNFWHRRVHCVFLSIPGGPVSQSVPGPSETKRLYQWRK